MKFLEIQDGLSVRIDDIIEISAIDNMTSSIKTSSDSYIANFPYNVILRLIEVENQKPELPKINEYEQFIRI
jgi:hypothetical protein